MRAGSGKRGGEEILHKCRAAAGRWRCGRVLELGAERTEASRLSVRFFRDRRAFTSLFFRFHLEEARRLRVGQGSAAEGQSQEKQRKETHRRRRPSAENRRDAQRAIVARGHEQLQAGSTGREIDARPCPLSAARPAVSVCADTAAAPGIFSKAAIRFGQVCDSR